MIAIPTDFTINTDRCLLRHVSEDDIPFIFSATQYAGFNDGMQWDPPAGPEELIESFINSCEAWINGDAFVFTIESDRESFLGRIVIRKTKTVDKWNIGFWIHPEHQGQGYMTEVARCIISFGFKTLSANEIEADHASWNMASKRILENVGMTWVQHIANGFQKKGKWVSVEQYSIKRGLSR